MVEADIDVLKGQARLRPASRLPLPLHSWLPQWSSLKRLKAFLLDQVSVVAFKALLLNQAIVVVFEALPLDQATTNGFQDWR